jgi:protein SCO1
MTPEPTPRSSNTATFVLAGMLLVGVLGIGAALLFARQPSAPVVSDNVDTYTGTAIEPPQTLSDFQLTDQHGETFSLSDVRGKVALLFFGFTHCPDYCPTTLLEYRSIYNQLGEEANDVAFLFITIDPERDTSEVLAEFISNFNESFIALTGSPDQISTVADEYSVMYERRDVGASYTMDHTVAMFMIDQQGRLVRRFSFGTETAVVAEQIRLQLARG